MNNCPCENYAKQADEIQPKAKAPRPNDLSDSARFHNMPCWSLPDACLDDPEVACDLARTTIASL